MIVLKQSIWDVLELPDWRARFFIECFTESLSVKTPHFHQAKMMGVLDLANEVLENIAIYEDNNKGKGYLISSLKELKLALDRDLIAVDVFKDLLGVFDDCTKNFSSDKFPKSLIIQLGILCKRITKEKEIYFKTLVSRLKSAISDDRDITKKETITSEIHSLTRAYVTFLLNSGYSPKYLFNKSQLLTRKGNYHERIFRDQLQFFFTHLDCKTREFRVFFGIKTNKKTTIINYKPQKGVKILSEIPDKHYTISTKTFSKFSPDFYIQVSVEALDYIGASLISYEKIESEFDLLKTLANRINLDLCNSCYVDYKAKGHTYQRDVNILLLNSLLTYDHRSAQLTHFLDFDFRDKIDISSMKTIEGILKNLRQTKESARLEQKLLNLWIALESLSYSGDDKSIISSIVSFLPKIYAIQSIKQRLDYVLSLLSKYEVTIPDEIKNKYNIVDIKFSNDLGLDLFYKISSDKDDAKIICQNIAELDFLYFRFYSLFKIISDNKKIKARISHTHEDIEKQLYRIYLKRNNIIHAGFSENLNNFAINHLSDYVNTLLLLTFDSMSNAKHLSGITLDEIILSTQLIVDNRYKHIESNSISSLDDLKLNVLI